MRLEMLQPTKVSKVGPAHTTWRVSAGSSSGGARDADHGERSRNPAPPSNPPRAPRPGACTRAAEAAAVATKRTHTRPDRVESPGPGWLLLPTSHASVLSPLQSQMVPELMASKKALVQKLRNTEVRRPMWFSTPPPAPPRRAGSLVSGR